MSSRIPFRNYAREQRTPDPLTEAQKDRTTILIAVGISIGVFLIGLGIVGWFSR